MQESMRLPMTCCGRPFEPRPQVPDQAFCSSPDCQRARKRQWQRDKLESDPDYRSNQQAAQRAWTLRNQDYWRARRETSIDSRQREPKQPAPPDARQPPPAKMDVSTLPSGIYRITKHPAFPRQDGDSWVVEITLLCATCPCKMDVSRDDLIDTRATFPSATPGTTRGCSACTSDARVVAARATRCRWCCASIRCCGR